MARELHKNRLPPVYFAEVRLLVKVPQGEYREGMQSSQLPSAHKTPDPVKFLSPEAFSVSLPHALFPSL